MCNLYNITTNQEAMRAITRAMIDHAGNLEPSLDVYPDRPDPVIRSHLPPQPVAPSMGSMG